MPNIRQVSPAIIIAVYRLANIKNNARYKPCSFCGLRKLLSCTEVAFLPDVCAFLLRKNFIKSNNKKTFIICQILYLFSARVQTAITNANFWHRSLIIIHRRTVGHSAVNLVTENHLEPVQRAYIHVLNGTQWHCGRSFVDIALRVVSVICSRRRRGEVRYAGDLWSTECV